MKKAALFILGVGLCLVSGVANAGMLNGPVTMTLNPINGGGGYWGATGVQCTDSRGVVLPKGSAVYVRWEVPATDSAGKLQAYLTGSEIINIDVSPGIDIDQVTKGVVYAADGSTDLLVKVFNYAGTAPTLIVEDCWK